MYYHTFLNSIIICINVLCSVSFRECFGHLHHIGVNINITHGEVWPKPMLQKSSDEYLKLVSDTFYFQVTGYRCGILEEAIIRYKHIFFLKSDNVFTRQTESSNITVVGILNRLSVLLENPCEDYPSVEMDEEYKIHINKTYGILSAFSIWGIIRGLETFSQLISLEQIDGPTFLVRSTSIQDCPKFKYRGFLMDTGRHFIPIPYILKTLDAMAYSKLNVFHWHIVDDQSFPFQSSVYPNLSAKGAFGPSAIYTKTDIKHVIEYARLRGIRVIPELDTPGHMASWEPGSIPSLITKCPDLGPSYRKPIDPTVKENDIFIRNLFSEISELFPDKFFHIGGDEVPYTCWKNDEKVQEFMLKHNMSTIKQLGNYYFQNIFKITRKLKNVPVVWEEVFDDGYDLDHNVVVQVWKSNYSTTLPKVMQSGYRVLLSSCWYLNIISYGSDWLKFYQCDPSKLFKLNKLFLGGETCIWGEYVDETNLLPRSWPRTCAMAEVLWSHELNETEAASRLNEHVCRMKRRGIPAQPANGPSYCSY